MNYAKTLSSTVGVANACDALAVPRSTFYDHRHRQQSPPPEPKILRPHPRALASDERQLVLDTLHSERFVDLAPAQVFATLLDDDDTYLCSERTMYRILDSENEVKERRNQRKHPNYAKPELLATAPNQVWSWDITKLKAHAKWTYFYLYVILDIFSRYVVGWLLAHRESTALAKSLISTACKNQHILPGQLIIHADRGASMTSKGVAQLLADLDVTKSHSRPYVSNDNPFSESHFKTLKYRAEFPRRFGSYQDTRAFNRAFFTWYNTQHRHSAIALLSPFDVHYGRADDILRARHQKLLQAYRAHPERFVSGPPQLPALPEAVWINPPLPRPDSPKEPSTIH